MSNINIFAQKSKVFNWPLSPLQSKDQAPWHVLIVYKYLWQFLYCTHSEMMTVSIISQWNFVFNMTLYTTRQSPIGSAKPIPTCLYKLSLYLRQWTCGRAYTIKDLFYNQFRVFFSIYITRPIRLQKALSPCFSTPLKPI